MSRSYGLLQMWDAAAAVVGDRECLVQGDRRLTWSQVADHSTRLSWWLTERGHGRRSGPVRDWESPNDLVGIYQRNSVEYLETSLACMRARCAPFNINYRYQAAELAYLLNDARPAAIVYHCEFAPVLSDALAQLTPEGQPDLVHVADDSGIEPLPGSVAYETALTTAQPPPTPVVPSPDDVHVLYTGGTTGMPKGVLWPLRELAGRPCGITLKSIEEAADGAARRGWLRALPAPPLMHGAALWFTYGAWVRGGTIVISQHHSFDARQTLELCIDEKVTWMAIVGDAFGRDLVTVMDDGGPVPGSISYIFSSGAILSDTVWQGLERHFPGLKLFNALGSSETGPQAMRTAPGQTQFTPGPQTTVASEDFTSLLGADAPGVGWLSNGGELPRGYLNDRARTQQTFRVVDGRRLAVSGDRAAVDAAGAITFLGRESGVINSAGEKIYAEEVESVLTELPQVQDALVFGRPSERFGSEVVALLVATAAGEVDRDTLRAECEGRLAGYKFPRAIRWVAEIHRHDNGKPDYAWAKELVGP